MKKFLLCLTTALVLAASVSDAMAQRRLGGGRNLGRQSAQPAVTQQRQATPPPTTSQNAAPMASPSAGQPTASMPRPSPWPKMLLGAAAGLGLMALASSLGWNPDSGVMLLIVAVVLSLLLFRAILRRASARQPMPVATQGGNARIEPVASLSPVTPDARPGSVMDEFASGARSSAGAMAPQTSFNVPNDFDTAGFIGAAKTCFVRLQEAWDRGSVDDLREFTTDDMLTALTQDVHARGAAITTQVIDLNAVLLAVERNADESIASVRFTGALRIAVPGAQPEDERVDEVWNFSRARNGGGWLLAGIQQLS